MNNQKTYLCGLGLMLGLYVGAFAKPAESWANWVENYYLSPEPEKIVTAVHALSRSGYFEQAGQPATAIGFLGAVFARNPDKVEAWMRDFRGLPAAHQRILAAALWYSGLPEGAHLLREMARNSPDDIRAEVESLASWERPSLEKTAVLSSSSLNLQWGAFLGNGDSRHVVNVLSALGSAEPSLNATARSALAEKALAHPRVYEICQAEIARQPANVREELSTALFNHPR